MSDQDLTSPTTDPFATAPAAEQVVVDSVARRAARRRGRRGDHRGRGGDRGRRGDRRGRGRGRGRRGGGGARGGRCRGGRGVEEAEAPRRPRTRTPSTRSASRCASPPGDWYVIHSYAGYENKVKGNIETRITSLNMEDYIFQVEVPMEEVTEIKSGERKLVRRNKFPGYVLVRMDLTDESWGAVRHTPGRHRLRRPRPPARTAVARRGRQDPRADPGEEAGRSRRPGSSGGVAPPSRSRSTSRSATRSPSSTARSPRSTPPSPRSTSRPRRSPASSRSSVARPLSSWRSTRSSRTSSTAPPHQLAAPHHHPGAPPPG